MVRFWIYLKLEPIRFHDGFDIVSARERGVKHDPTFSGLTKFEMLMAEVWKASRQRSFQGTGILFWKC